MSYCTVPMWKVGGGGCLAFSIQSVLICTTFLDQWDNIISKNYGSQLLKVWIMSNMLVLRFIWKAWNAIRFDKPLKSESASKQCINYLK